MPTLDQPFFTEGYCLNCKEYFCIVHIGDDGKVVIHKCGARFTPEWRRLVVDSHPLICPICTSTVYREKVTPIYDTVTKRDISKAATFLVVDGKAQRHMCEVALKDGDPPSGEPLHPDFYKKDDGAH